MEINHEEKPDTGESVLELGTELLCSAFFWHKLNLNYTWHCYFTFLTELLFLVFHRCVCLRPSLYNTQKYRIPRVWIFFKNRSNFYKVYSDVPLNNKLFQYNFWTLSFLVCINLQKHRFLPKWIVSITVILISLLNI